MFRIAFLLMAASTAWGQTKLPAIITAEKLLATSPQKAIAIAKGIFSTAVVKSDHYNTTYSSLLLSTAYRQSGNHAKALDYDSAAMLNARYSNDTLLLRKAVNNYASDLLSIGKIYAAKYLLQKYKLAFSDLPDSETCRWYMLCGYCYANELSLDSAIKNYRDGLLIAGDIADTVSVMYLKLLLGKAYINKTRPDSVRLVYEAFEYFQHSKKYSHAANAAGVIAQSFRLAFNLDFALLYYEKAFELSKTGNNALDREEMRSGMGDIYQLQKKYDAAKAAFYTSFHFYKKINNPYRIATATLTLANLYVELEQYDSANYYFNQAELAAKHLHHNKLLGVIIGSRLKLAVKQHDLHAVDSLGTITVALLLKGTDKEIISNIATRLTEGNFFLQKELNKTNSLSDTGAQATTRPKGKYNLSENQVSRLSNLNQFTGDDVSQDSSIVANSNRLLLDIETKYKTRIKEDSIKAGQLEISLARKDIRSRNHIIYLSAGLFLCAAAGFWLQYKNRKRAESDKQKIELLQNEIHHRVKNNLAVLNRVVEVAGKDDVDNIPAVALKNRIRSIELLHQHLYSGQAKTGNISLQTYFTDLCTAIAATFETTKPIRISVKAPVEVESHIAEKLGLIVNELVTNSFKYAFPEREAGAINIMAQQQKDQLYLAVTDDGIGMEAAKNTKSYGMKLIKGLSRELDGKFVFENVNGAVFKLAVPIMAD